MFIHAGEYYDRADRRPATARSPVYRIGEMMQELDRSEIDDVLEGNGIGVLAVDGGSHPYPIPVAYGYESDSELFVLQLEDKPGSYKQQCLDLNPNVGFTVYEETEPGTVWRSVVLEGQLRDSSFQEAESAFATLAKHSQSAPNRVIWSNKSEDAEIRPYELEITDWAGREFVLK